MKSSYLTNLLEPFGFKWNISTNVKALQIEHIHYGLFLKANGYGPVEQYLWESETQPQGKFQKMAELFEQRSCKSVTN